MDTKSRIDRVQDEEFSSFLDYLIGVKGYSEKTQISYGEDVASFLLFLSDEKRSKESVDRELIRTYILELNVRSLNKRSIKRALSALRHFYTYLVTYKGYKDNPFELVATPKVDKRLPEFLSEEEINDFLDSNKKRTDRLALRDQAILEILFAAGLRCSELISLKLNQIDMADKSIRVVGKGNKERIVLFSETAKAALKDYLDELRVKLVSVEDKDEGIVFLNGRGEPLTERGLEHIVSESALKSGFPLKVHPHMLRHSFATELLNHGADLRVIQELMGHESIAATSVYTHVSYADMKKTYDRCFPKGESKSMNDKVAVFDFNGTMFLDDKKHEVSWRRFALEKFGRQISDEEFVSHIHGFNNKEILEYLAERKFTEKEVMKLTEEKELMYQRLCEEDKENLHLTPGLVPFLDELKRNHVTLAIATASRKPNVDWYIRTFDLLRWFRLDHIIYDDGTLTKGKPDPMIYLRTMERLHVKPENVVVFEDAMSGIHSAYGAKVSKIVALEKESKSNLTDEVDYYIHDFSHVPAEIKTFLSIVL